jgi:mono/diheme cytochrome c family protein
MGRAFLLMLASVALPALPVTDTAKIFHAERSSAGDLEVGGSIRHLRPGSTRFVRYEDLLRLPQETYTVSDDSNLAAKTEISGVPLETLARMVGQLGADTTAVAICDDRYRANYPADYVAAHRPLLVLRINGKLRDQWPLSKEGGKLGPYLISHPFFKPAFHVLSHEDQPQIPYGVIRIEFQRQSAVFGAIQPKGSWPQNSPVEQGFRIAREDCFRCHNMGAVGGTKAGRSWFQLAAIAAKAETRFRQIIRDPQAVDPKATMPANTDYDDPTLTALTAYFKTFDRVESKQ